MCRCAMYNEVAHGHSVMYKLKRENKMKQEFELTLDNNGRPCISFKHDERAKDLEQKVKDLEQIVGKKQIMIDYLEKMMEIAKDELDIDIKKNFNTSQSAGSGKTKKK